jgi:hypothetical protein
VCDVVLHLDEGPRVAVEDDDRERAEHGVDRAPLETELAKMGSCEKSGSLYQ